MENASKALIIAGAILLAIAIIGIGMYVYQNASNAIQGANMDQQAITTYNSEFVKYQGTIKGSDAKSLCDTVMAHNVANASDDTKQVNVTASTTDLTGKTLTASESADKTNATSAAITTVKNGLASGKTYNVTFDYTETGLIKKVNIK